MKARKQKSESNSCGVVLSRKKVYLVSDIFVVIWGHWWWCHQ